MIDKGYFISANTQHPEDAKAFFAFLGWQKAKKTVILGNWDICVLKEPTE